MKTLVKLTGVYNISLKESEDYNIIENLNILEDSNGSYKITRICECYGKDPNIFIRDYKTDSAFFDNYINQLCWLKSNKKRKEAQIAARILFDYIIFEIIGDTLNFQEVDYKIIYC